MKRYYDIVKDVFSFAPDKKIYVFQLLFSCILRILSSLLPPIATAGIIKVITEGTFSGIWFYVVLYILFYAIYFCSVYWNYGTYSKLGSYYYLSGQKKIIEKVANNEEIFEKVSKGKILDTCSEDVYYIVDVIDSSVEVIVGILKLFMVFFIFTYYNIYAAIIALLVFIAYLKLMNDNSKLVSKHYEGQRKNNDKIMDLFNQMLINVRQVKTLNMLPSLEKKMENPRVRWQENYEKRRSYIVERYSKLPIIIYIGKIFLYIFLGYLVTISKMSIDILILLISYFEMSMTQADEILEYLLDLSNYGIRIKRITTILNAKSNGINDFGDLENDYINGIIKFNKVTYKVKDNVILNNVSFKVYPNEINAIVGPVGAGKTSIINLLYRLNKVTKGDIMIDNANIYDYSNRVYYSNVSGVYQKPFVFEMSIKDNLGLVNDNEEEQIQVCKRIGIHNAIMRLPQGYNTKVSEDNAILDENQKQLLMIARAILSKAEILLFDEVTNHVDDKTTSKIIEIVKDLKKDHTIIMVTRKPEMMDIADRVVVLNEGKVVASGLRKDVNKNCSLYKELKKKDSFEEE